MNLPFITDDTWFIDNSSLEVIQMCHRKADYALIRKRKPAEERIALCFGAAIHTALEALYKGEDAREALNTAWEEMPPTMDHRTLPYAHRILNEYDIERLGHNWKVHTHKGKPLVELAFAIPLGRIGRVKVVWTGKIDIGAVVGDNLFVLDHKTTSVFGKTFFDNFRLSGQPIGYLWALEQHLQTELRGFIINCIILHKAGPKFASELFYVSRDRVEEWKENTLMLLSDFLTSAERGHYPMSTYNTCVGKFGKCTFYETCQLPRASRDRHLMSPAYTESTWSPLNKEEK